MTFVATTDEKNHPAFQPVKELICNTGAMAKGLDTQLQKNHCKKLHGKILTVQKLLVLLVSVLCKQAILMTWLGHVSK